MVVGCSLCCSLKLSIALRLDLASEMCNTSGMKLPELVYYLAYVLLCISVKLLPVWVTECRYRTNTPSCQPQVGYKV